MTKKHKQRRSGKSSEEPTKENQDAHVQEVNESEESGVYASEPDEIRSTEINVSRTKKQRQKRLGDIFKESKHKKHKTDNNESNESQQIVDSEKMIESPNVSSVWSDHLSSTDTSSPKKSVDVTKKRKRKNSSGTPTKHKRKKQKTTEEESSESQEIDVSGYNEPVPETSLALDEILGSSAQKVIAEADTKKPVDYKTATKSFPLLTKSNDGQRFPRLAEFKGHNSVSYGTWRKICKDLEKDGKIYNTGRFSQEENDQLRKNWTKLTKSCPFEKPHVLLMKNHFPDLKNDIENYVKDTNFYVRLGKYINRPLYNVYIRARKMFHPGNGKGSYTEEEVEMLKRHYHEHGNHWQMIGQQMDRSGQSLIDKFKRLKSTVVSGRWSPEEDRQLREAIKNAVSDHTNEEDAYFNFPWKEIANGVPSRNAKQCREHWLNMLAFGNEGKTKFGKEDKIRLIYEIMAMDVSQESEINWIELKSKFDVPSPQYLQHKWYLLRVKVPDFQKCSLREVLEYLERKIVPGMKAILKKKREGLPSTNSSAAGSDSGDITVISQTSHEASPKSTTQHEEVEGDEEEKQEEQR